VGGVTERRISKLEQTFGGEACVFCEQSYWSTIATNKAIGPYSETTHGNEAGLVVSRELEALLPEQDRDPHYLEHLPTYDLATEHAGVIEVWRRVEESRPPREGCGCFETWLHIRSVEVRVLYHYPKVADALVEALKEYAASPLRRPIYHFPGGTCACR
jgi:hypothetical protein